MLILFWWSFFINMMFLSRICVWSKTVGCCLLSVDKQPLAHLISPNTSTFHTNQISPLNFQQGHMFMNSLSFSDKLSNDMSKISLNKYQIITLATDSYLFAKLTLGNADR